jgi:hypothetical protein
MVTITATCPACGGVTLSADEIELWVFPDGSADDFYAFTCPGCDGRVEEPADARVVRLLRSGGIEPVAGGVHPEGRPLGLPPLTEEEAEVFAGQLAAHDCLAEVAERDAL